MFDFLFKGIKGNKESEKKNSSNLMSNAFEQFVNCVFIIKKIM